MEGSPKHSLAVPARGRLEETSAFRLCYLIAAAESAGLLWLGEGMESVAIWMKQGTPQAVHCEALRLDTYLLETGTLKKAQLEAAAPFIGRAGGDVLTGLFSAGVLNPSETFPLIQQHALAVLWRGFALEKGPFTYDPAISAPASAFPLGNRWQILSNGARRLERAVVVRRLQPHEGEAPLLNGSTVDLALTAQETRIVANLDGSRSLQTLVGQLGPDADSLRRLALLLQEVDRLRWVAPTGAQVAAPKTAPAAATQPSTKAAAQTPARPASAPAPAASTVSPPKPSPPPAPAPTKNAPAASSGEAGEAREARGMNVAELRQFVTNLKAQDFFARLGLLRESGPLPNLKTNYLKLAKTYHPDMVPQDAPPEMKDLRVEILAFLNEAYQELSDDARRAHYLEELETAEAVGDVDINAILEAEEHFQRATQYFRARKYPEALALIDGCIERNEKEGEFYAWRGFLRFLVAPDKRAVHAKSQQDLHRALELNPRCSVAHLFDGHMFKLLEAHPDAQRAYQRVLQIEPGNIEAQRELRLYEQRKR
jgi:hypothetical protein